MSSRSSVTNIFIPPMVRPVPFTKKAVVTESENRIVDLLESFNTQLSKHRRSGAEFLPPFAKSRMDADNLIIEGYAYKTQCSSTMGNEYLYTYTVEWISDKPCDEFTYVDGKFELSNKRLEVSKTKPDLHAKNTKLELIDRKPRLLNVHGCEQQASLSEFESIDHLTKITNSTIKLPGRPKVSKESTKASKEVKDRNANYLKGTETSQTKNLKGISNSVDKKIYVHIRTIPLQAAETGGYVDTCTCLKHTIRLILGLAKGGLKKTRIYLASSSRFSKDGLTELDLKMQGSLAIKSFKTGSDTIYLLVDFSKNSKI